MTSAPTFKALLTVLFVILFGLSVTAIGEAIGHDAPTAVSAPATSPYSQVEAPTQRAAHNRSEVTASTHPGHNH
jgi:hypothetical protein